MGTVVDIGCISYLDLPPERIIAKAGEGDLESVIVVGWTKGEDGETGRFYFASSIAAGPEVLWLLEVAKKRLLAAGDPD